MSVTIAVLNKDAFFMLNKIIDNITSQIDEEEIERMRNEEYGYGNDPEHYERRRRLEEEERAFVRRNNSQSFELNEDTKSFADMMWYYMGIRHEDPPVIYKRVNMDRKQFNKYYNNNRQPSKKDAIKICIGLRLTISESVDLLSRADYAFNPSSPTDMEIVRGIKEGKSYSEISSSLEEKHLDYFKPKK